MNAIPLRHAEKSMDKALECNRGIFRDSLQLSCIPMLNDNVSVQWFIIVFRLDNNSSDFICCRPIVTTGIINGWVTHHETNSQLCILCNPFSCILPKLNIGIQLSKDGAQQLKDIKLQIWMSFMTELQLLLSGIEHVNLCKTGSLARRKEKTAH